MSNIAGMKKSLPSIENSFSISVEGNLTKEQFDGNFICKIPNIKTQAAIAKHKAMLNGGFDDGLDISTRNMHHMISYLRYTLTEMPKWWKDEDYGYNLFDINVVESVYYKVLDFEKAWYEEVWGPVAKEEVKGDGQQ